MCCSQQLSRAFYCKSFVFNVFFSSFPNSSVFVETAENEKEDTIARVSILEIIFHPLKCNEIQVVNLQVLTPSSTGIFNCEHLRNVGVFHKRERLV